VQQIEAYASPKGWTEESKGRETAGRKEFVPIERSATVSRTPPQANVPAPWPEDPVEILRLVHPRLMSAARSVDPTVAEDLVQEALVDILSRHPDFRGIAHPLGYAKVTMFRIALRRSRVRHLEVPLELAERLEAQPDPAERVVDRLRLRDALAGLGRRQRACLLLRSDGLDDGSIAAVLGCRPSTVRSQIARASSHMREALDDAEEVEPT